MNIIDPLMNHTENMPIEDIVETDGFKNFGTPDKQSGRVCQKVVVFQ